MAGFIGTTRQTVAAFEKGQRKPDVDQLARLGNLYRLTLDELVGGVRSAVAPPTAAPAMLPRLNKTNGLDDQDRDELVQFEQYLQRRPATKARPFKAAHLETVSETVSRLRGEFAKTDAPVPVFAIAARLGIEIRFTALGELAGALIMPTGEHPAGILVNSDQPFERQRFSAAHELGHLVLDHQPEDGRFVSFLGRRFEPQEVDADNFAGELLTPTELLKTKAETLKDHSLEEAVYLLSRAFAVSFQAMTTRLSKIGALRPIDLEQLAKVKPTQVARQVDVPDDEKVCFKVSWLPKIARESLASGWEKAASPDTVRTLQESAYLHYLMKTPEGCAGDAAGRVYEQVARWVAEKFPVSTIAS